MIGKKRESDDWEEKKYLLKTLYMVKHFDNQKDIKEIIEDAIYLACQYFHVKKGYYDKYKVWVENPDYELLMYWISDKSGFIFDGKQWIEGNAHKARLRFD